MTDHIWYALTTAVLVIILAIAVFTDLTKGKIYNKITVPGILMGLLLNTGWHGKAGFTGSLLAIVISFVLGYVVFRAAGMGGGDVKLIMAVGALGGWHVFGWAMLYTGVVGGILTIVNLLYKKELLSTFGNLFNVFRTKGAVPLENDTKRSKLKYGPAIAVGALLAYFFKGAVLHLH